MSGRRRVLVTGIGPVTPVGIGIEPFWDSLVAGRGGAGPIDGFDTSRLAVRIAALVNDFVPSEFVEPKVIRRTDRVTHLAVAASRLAWRDAGEPEVDPSRTGVLISTGIGGLNSLLEQYRIFLERGPDRVSPFTVPRLMPNASAGHVAIAFGFTGANACVTTACAAGAHAVGEASRWIRDGRIDVAIAGGSESAVSELTITAFAQMQALSRNPDPKRASRPFDRDRDGFVMAEGACALILEAEEHALARGARIYAEVAGYGATADAYHETAPEPEGRGAVEAMNLALEDAGETVGAVDYINAHGTSTSLNDAAETKAIRRAFGEDAYRVPVSSTKSMTGHMLGAAGAVEAAVCALAIGRGVVPPTINYETPDPDCDLDYVPNEARKVDVRLALSNSFGFGGQNAVLAIRRYEPSTT